MGTSYTCTRLMFVLPNVDVMVLKYIPMTVEHVTMDNIT